jgi:predicted nucleic acid-binding Zn ribbon protein
MNCPNCGSQTFADQQFCRSCGAGLAEGEKRSFNPQILGPLMLLLAIVGVMLAMSGKLFDQRWLTFTGVFIMMSGVLIVAVYALMRQLRPRKRKPASPPQPAAIERADTTNKLLPVGDNDFIPAVTEATTNLLKTPAPGRSDRRD